MSNNLYDVPRAAKIKPQADIVFCIDATSSMKPCLKGVLDQVGAFVQALHSAGNVDFRLRLIAYRDKHDPSVSHQEWQIHDFTNSVDEFRSQLENVSAIGGGDPPESTLDALYVAIHSNWRAKQTHRTILLLSDADTHPTLHPTTYGRPDGNVLRVVQDLQTLRHVMLYMVVPETPTYNLIQRSIENADCKIIADFLESDQIHDGLKNIDWKDLLTSIGNMVSNTSVQLAQGA